MRVLLSPALGQGFTFSSQSTKSVALVVGPAIPAGARLPRTARLSGRTQGRGARPETPPSGALLGSPEAVLSPCSLLCCSQGPSENPVGDPCFSTRISAKRIIGFDCNRPRRV